MLVENPRIRTTVFAFLDLDHPPVAWAVSRGMLISADLNDQKSSDGFVSFMQAGMIEHQDNVRVFNEFLIERMRPVTNPHAISRLRGMYFFPDEASALARVGDYEWPPYFKPENLVELELTSPSNVTIVDSDWITYAPRRTDDRIDTDQLDWIGRYWKGEPRSSNPVWEYIATGVAVVLDESVRRRCFATLKKRFPESEIPILMARLAGEAGSRGGAVAPFLIRKDNATVRLTYLFYDGDFHVPEVIARISEHPDSRYLGHLMATNENWRLPDFREWDRELRVDVQADPIGAIGTIPSVHHVWSFAGR